MLAVLASAAGVLSIASPAPEARAAASGSSLAAGETLHPGEFLASAPFGNHRLKMQADGNLVLYVCDMPGSDDCTYAHWSLGTFGQPGNYLTMQYDGNLVMYSRTGRPVWATRTTGVGNVFRVQDDSNLVIYNGGRAVWATGTVHTYAHVAGRRVPDLRSPNGRYRFSTPGNGMTVLDVINRSDLWSINCLDDPRVNCSVQGKLVLQTDGNLVWYQPGRNGGWVAEWNSGTAGYGPTTYLVMQNDGNAVLYDLWHRPLWSSNTGLIRR
jgi:hypothetical protein